MYDSIIYSGISSSSSSKINLLQEGRSYETKGGPIHSLVSCNVAKFSSEDVLVGDTNGLLTIITNGQILKRTQLCNSKINAMVLDVDSGIKILIFREESICGRNYVIVLQFKKVIKKSMIVFIIFCRDIKAYFLCIICSLCLNIKQKMI